MCLDKLGNKKAYGGGIMSSFGELEYCLSNKPKYLPLDPYLIAAEHINFPISSMQPLYFVAESFEKAKSQIKDYCDNVNKPFNVSYNLKLNSIEVDRKLKTRPEKVDTSLLF